MHNDKSFSINWWPHLAFCPETFEVRDKSELKKEPYFQELHKNYYEGAYLKK